MSDRGKERMKPALKALAGVQQPVPALIEKFREELPI
jgi:hypothetical protein